MRFLFDELLHEFSFPDPSLPPEDDKLRFLLPPFLLKKSQFSFSVDEFQVSSQSYTLEYYTHEYIKKQEDHNPIPPSSPSLF
jgi:hypothetical protein